MVTTPTAFAEVEEFTVQHRSIELVTLVRKLRWIGLDEEAAYLQQALGAISTASRVPVVDGMASTD
jgi:hypothetical protein